MFMSQLRISLAASAFALALALFSTGLVVAHNCHTEVSNVTAHVAHGHSLPDKFAGSSQNLFDEICIGIIFFFLILGGKNLHKISNFRGFQRLDYILRQAFNYIRPPNLTNSLSLVQLGVSRI